MKTTIIWASVLGAIGIMLGALGAHSLKSILTPDQISSFETGVRYQMYHALFLLFIGLIQKDQEFKALTFIRNLVIIGVFCFSFSIYFLNLQDAMGVSLKFLGPITPLGGLLMILAWVLLLIKVPEMLKKAEK